MLCRLVGNSNLGARYSASIKVIITKSSINHGFYWNRSSRNRLPDLFILAISYKSKYLINHVI